MKVENIHIKNFKGIDKLDVDLGGKSVYLIGGNATGKTSFIDAVYCGITGKNIPPEPVKTGNKTGEVSVDLGDYIAITKFTKGKPAEFLLQNKVFNDKTDKFVKSPRTVLNSMIGILDFDLNKFFGKSDAEQVKYFAEISGADFTDLDNDIEELYESRKSDKKKLQEYEGKIIYYDKKDAEREPVSVVEASKILEAARDKVRVYREGEDAHGEVSTKILEVSNEIIKLYTDLYGECTPGDMERIFTPGHIPAEGSLLKKQKSIKAWLDDAENMPLPSEKVLELADNFENLEADNEKIRKAKEGKDVDQNIEKYRELIEKADEEILEKKREKAKRISKNLTVEGLDYDLDNERFLYQGLPFDNNQINTASQLIAGMKIGSMLLKDLQILRIDASLIDKKEFDKVMQWAEEHKIQLFVELVDREAEALQVVIHED